MAQRSRECGLKAQLLELKAVSSPVEDKDRPGPMGCHGGAGGAQAVVAEWPLWLFLQDQTSDAHVYGTGCHFSFL